MLSMLRKPRSRGDTGIVSDNTRRIARERLQSALNRDRYDLLSPGVMEDLKRDMLAAISRHLDVDGEFYELEIRRLNESFHMTVNVRIQTMPRWATVS